jgi:hypothetical protein
MILDRSTGPGRVTTPIVPDLAWFRKTARSTVAFTSGGRRTAMEESRYVPDGLHRGGRVHFYLHGGRQLLERSPAVR